MRNEKQKGFTLVEFLIYAGIVVFVMTALTLTAINILHARVRITSIEEVAQNGRFATEKMTHTIRNAESIESASGNSLVLEVPSSRDDPTEFTVEDSRLVIIKGERDPSVLTTGMVIISDLDFSQISETAVEAEMVVEFYNPSGRTEYELTRTFRIMENIRK